MKRCRITGEPASRQSLRLLVISGCLALWLSGCAHPGRPTAPAPPSIDPARFAPADAVITAGIEQGELPGAVLIVGRGDEIVYRKSYGHRLLKPDAVAMTEDTIFDLASLTKPIATATSVMILVDRGKVKLSDPVSKYLPAFAQNDKANVTVEQLLLHQSGLTPDNALSDYAGGHDAAIARVMALRPTWPVGARFKYSDVGFIVLGELVHAIDGRPLDVFVREEMCTPLGMRDTSYNPPESWRSRIAPTAPQGDNFIFGEVHDPRSSAMGGVAGHAGLFSTADDLARWCRMLLHAGTLDGHRVLSAATVREMLRPRAIDRPDSDAMDYRSLGFDVDTPYSSARGDRFPRYPAGTTFGHTGFTGPSFWVDPVNKCYYVFLCSRLYPGGKGNVLKLRRDVATAVAKALLDE